MGNIKKPGACSHKDVPHGLSLAGRPGEFAILLKEGPASGEYTASILTTPEDVLTFLNNAMMIAHMSFPEHFPEGPLVKVRDAGQGTADAPGPRGVRWN